MYGCELLQYNAKYMSQLYVAWRKSIRRVFRLPSQTHNYVVLNLGGCIIERLDHRLTKYIYNILHGDNNVIKQLYIVNYTLSPKSLLQRTISIYHTNISYITLTGQRVSVISLIKLVQKLQSSRSKSIALRNTIRELCEIRDGTKQCEIVLNIEFVSFNSPTMC